MTKKARTIRIIVNSVLLLAIIALGVTVYQSGSEGRKQKQLAMEKQAELEEQARLEEKREQAQAEEEAQEPMVDAGTSQVEAEMSYDSSAEETADAQTEDSTKAASAADAQAEAGIVEETQIVEMTPDTSVLPQVNFSEDSLMIWPLSGDIVMDYNMEQTIYHPTLDQYKYSPGIAISAAVESPVLAAANGTVTEVREDAETGTTVTVDMGNGYQAVYGQLQNVQVSTEQTIGESAIIGYVAEPTKYYSVEGSNLYFAMTKDGVSVDPIQYLP